MVHVVSAAVPSMGVTHTPAALCRLLGGRLGGNVVMPPQCFGFPHLGRLDRVVTVPTHARRSLPAGGPPCVLRAVGLLTCASVIYANAAGDLYLHHANAGAVSPGDFAEALAALGTAAAGVWIIYAHREASDPGYTASLRDLTQAGVPEDQVVEVTDLRFDTFGVNHLGWLGY